MYKIVTPGVGFEPTLPLGTGLAILRNNQTMRPWQRLFSSGFEGRKTAKKRQMGLAGFEPATPRSSVERSSRLSYSPMETFDMTFIKFCIRVIIVI